MAETAKIVRRELTAEEKRKVEATRVWARLHEDEIRELAKVYREHPGSSVAQLSDVVELLKMERLRQSLSLAQLQERTGNESLDLSSLETDAAANPTISTLQRYANALGKRLYVVIDDLPEPT